MERVFAKKPAREIWFRVLSIGPIPIVWLPVSLKGLLFVIAFPLVTLALLLGATKLLPNSDIALAPLPLMFLLYIFVVARYSDDW